MYIDNTYVTILNVHYVPTLGESVYSLLTHIKQKDHGLHSISDQGLFLLFPTFKTKAIIGAHDIYLNAFPSKSDATSSDFQPLDISSTSLGVTQLQKGIDLEIRKLDNLLVDLHKYYNSV